MNGEVTLGIYVMSYHRYNCIRTQNLLDDCTYVVRESEAELYRQAGVKKVWAAPDEEVNNAIKTYWWIVDNAPEDIVFVADDDIKNIFYRTDITVECSKEDFMDEIYRVAQLMVDLGVGYACSDATTIPYNYTQEFTFKGTSGSIKWANKLVLKARPDESVKYNYDLDLIIQELLYNRIILKPKYLCSKGEQDTNAGGDSSKLRQDQIDSINNMKRKWGKNFDYDFKHNRPRITTKR